MLPRSPFTPRARRPASLAGAFVALASLASGGAVAADIELRLMETTDLHMYLVEIGRAHV